MLPECAWYCKETYIANFRINLQFINYEMNLIYLICKLIIIHQFISPVNYNIRRIPQYVFYNEGGLIFFYFQYSFLEIRIINMHVIIHGSVIIHMCSKAENLFKKEKMIFKNYQDMASNNMNA